MQCIWRRICMIHIHIQEPTQRDNFNINPSAVCLLCSEMLHRIIQIFIDGSSAGALLAAFAFFSCLSWAVLPSFLCTENIACAQHCPSASSSGNSSHKKKHISGSGVPFSALVTAAIPRSRAAFLCHMLHQEWRSLLCFLYKVLLGLLRQRSLFNGSLYTENKLWLC